MTRRSRGGRPLHAGAPALAARFAAAAGTYERHAVVQDTVAARVAALAVARCGSEYAGRILEVGCGTGLLTRRLRRHFPRASIVATDFAWPLLAAARQKLRGDGATYWLAADARALPCQPVFALVVSSSSLHWMTPLEALFQHLRGLLVADGRLVAGLMLAGTLAELHGVRQSVAPHKAPPARLPVAAEVRQAARTARLKIDFAEEVELRAQHASARDFLKAIHRQGLTGGAVSHGAGLLTRAELARLAADYDRRHRDPQGGVYATYRVMYLAASKGGRSKTEAE